MSDFLQEKKQEIESRMEEIKPLVDEYHRLEAAARALDGVRTGAAPEPQRRIQRASGGGGGGGGRPKGSGSRAKETLDKIKAQPGISIPELAEAMGMTQANYLYRVTGELQKDGLIRKEGRGLYALDAA
jgi:hypothetical protein